jgi:glycerol-3-phosphate dehydrogenase
MIKSSFKNNPLNMDEPKAIFDIAIIGGGIAGAAIARDASLRGAQVIVFEKSTFGSGTSSKSSKLIHGGIRYLELAWNALKRGQVAEGRKNFGFVISALRESTLLEHMAPDLIRPIELVIPIYRNEGQNVWAVYFGAAFYGLLALLTGNRKGPRILMGQSAVLKLIPNLNPKNLAGGVLIWDHITDDKHLVEEIMRSAVSSGAQALEHATVQNYLYDAANQYYEISVEESAKRGQVLDLSQEPVPFLKEDERKKLRTFKARTLINASGPWVDKIRTKTGEKTDDFLVPVAGSHIMVRRFTDYSVILRAQDNRIFFCINMGPHSRIGTTERVHKDPDTVRPLDEEVEYLLCALERYFPNVKLSPEDILSKDSGIRPLAKPREAKTPHDISREHEIRVGPTGVIHVLGVKLTDHRRAAKDVVNRLIPALRKFNPNIKTKSLTHQIPL